MKRTIGLAEARAKPSQVVNSAGAGQTIVILRNGKTVAEVRPVTPPPVSDTVDRILALRQRIVARASRAKIRGRLRDFAHEGYRH